jgi:hypothetical protein
MTRRMTREMTRAANKRPAWSRLAIAMALVLAGAAWTRGAAAEAVAEVDDSIVFIRDHALWRVPAEGDSGAVEVVALGEETVTGLVASPVGDAVIVEFGERVGWVPLTGRPATLHALDCRPPARFSPDGRYVACAGPGASPVAKPNAKIDAKPGAKIGAKPDAKPDAKIDAKIDASIVLYTLPGQQRSLIDAPAAQIVGFLSGSRLAVTDKDGVWAVPTEPGAQRALLAPHRPSGVLLIGPHGRRAVGVYPALSNHKSPGLYVFRLDGKGVRRRLLPDAEPVAWSRDDRWVAVQNDNSACLVRATGGQYKCWKRYQALSMSPDGRYLLLGKSSEKEGQIDLYRGERDGVRPAAPMLMERAVTGPAVWVPACTGCR